MKVWKIYDAAMERWGADSQTMMVMEEMSELQKELCKNLRGADNRLSIAEEIADVQIMLEQMMNLYECETLVEQYKRLKLKRLAERLGLEEYE